MTTKTSLFNKGVYKSTVKRYLWGGILYLALLFMSTGLAIFLEIGAIKEYGINYEEDSLLLSASYLSLPMLMAMVVPTVTGLLVFRFVHSKKASVFTHSLPTSRISNYISSVFAGFTLMLAPIVINTLTLMLISVTIGREYFSIADCTIWMLCNMFGIFIMFSVTCFVSFLTGNGFAMVAFNFLIYVLPLVLAEGLNRIAEVFLLGYPGGGEITTSLLGYCFPVQAFSVVEELCWQTTSPESGEIWVILAMAVVLYVLAAALYVKRNMEKVGDIAGFRRLSPVFKYLVTFMGAVIVFSLLGNVLKENAVVSSVIAIIVCAIIYFGTEMLLKKTTNVLPSVKGFAVMIAICGAMLYLVVFTSFFGYETRVPDYEQISGVFISEYYEGEVRYATGEEAIKTTMKLHNELIDNTIEYDEWGPSINIKYRLKNGKFINRTYTIHYEELPGIINRIYQVKEFKKLSEPIFMDEVTYVEATIYDIEEPIIITKPETIESLANSIQKDMENIDFDSMNVFGWEFSIEFTYVRNGKDLSVDNRDYYAYKINSNYKETIKWLKENGYWDNVEIDHDGPILIVKNTGDIPYRDYADGVKMNLDDGIIIDGEEREKLYEFIYAVERKGEPSIDDYLVYLVTDEEDGMCELLTVLPEEAVKEFIK